MLYLRPFKRMWIGLRWPNRAARAMLPGMLNEYWFYVAELKRINNPLERLWGCFSFTGPAKEHFEITVKLYWEYYGLRSLSRKFYVNLVSWDTAEIRSLKNTHKPMGTS